MTALAADVLGLQEAYQCQERYLCRALARSGASYDAVGVGRIRPNRGERCPVLFRPERFTVESSATRWFADDPDAAGSRLEGATFPRIATVVELTDRASGTRFGIANVHLDEHRADHRLRSARMLASWLTPETPWLVVGDLNEGPDGPAVEELSRHGFRPALPPDAPGTTHAFDGSLTGHRIDHVLVSPEWEVQGAGVWHDARRPYPSDHWPVYADVRLAAS